MPFVLFDLTDFLRGLSPEVCKYNNDYGEGDSDGNGASAAYCSSLGLLYCKYDIDFRCAPPAPRLLKSRRNVSILAKSIGRFPGELLDGVCLKAIPPVECVDGYLLARCINRGGRATSASFYSAACAEETPRDESAMMADVEYS